MIAADTNVWARAYLNDDAAQAAQARSAIEAGCLHGGIFVPLIVLAELSRVLASRWQQDRVLDTLEHLLQTDGVAVESPTIVAQALQEAHAHAATFADLLLAHVARAHGAGKVITMESMP